MTALVVIGVDPGPIPGLAVLAYADGHLAETRTLQCSANFIALLLREEIVHAKAPINGALTEDEPTTVLLSVERYLPSKMGNRMLAAGQNAQTRDMAARLVAEYAQGWPWLRTVSYPAAPVMRWATEDRLRKVGAWEITTGCAHARSAAKHALYAAVKDGNMPDPLSRKA